MEKSRSIRHAEPVTLHMTAKKWHDIYHLNESAFTLLDKWRRDIRCTNIVEQKRIDDTIEVHMKFCGMHVACEITPFNGVSTMAWQDVNIGNQYVKFEPGTAVHLVFTEEPEKRNNPMFGGEEAVFQVIQYVPETKTWDRRILTTSSTRLVNLIKRQWAKIQGKVVAIKPEGEGFDRVYTMSIAKKSLPEEVKNLLSKRDADPELLGDDPHDDILF